MGGKAGEIEAVGWVATDESGCLSPFSFKRRDTGPNDVKLKVKFCGVCHSDWSTISNEWGNAVYPIVPGHECVGVVEEVGQQVTKFKVGDTCGLSTYVNSCRTCSTCEQRLPQYCAKGTVWTYNCQDYNGSASQIYCVNVRSNLPMDAAAPRLCAGLTVFSHMKRYAMRKGGKNFGVVGLGGLGHIACKFAKAMGMHVTVFSSSSSKEQMARENLGVDNFIVSKDPDQMKAAFNTIALIIDTVSAPHPLDPYIHALTVTGELLLCGLSLGSFEISTFLFVLGMVWGVFFGIVRLLLISLRFYSMGAF